MIQLDGVRRRLKGGRLAVRDVDLVLPDGVTGLLGVNGAGKSSLLEMLATLVAPTAGEIRWNGMSADGRGRSAVRRRIGYLPQSFQAPSSFTCRAYVEHMCWLRGADRPTSRERADRALRVVGLADRADERGRRLSGGMQRRLGLAQAIALEPRFLLLDEPTTGLDPVQRAGVRELVGGSAAEGRTVVVASHVVEDILQVCQQVVVLHEGRIASVHSRDELVRAGLGSPAALEAHLARVAGTPS